MYPDPFSRLAFDASGDRRLALPDGLMLVAGILPEPLERLHPRTAGATPTACAGGQTDGKDGNNPASRAEINCQTPRTASDELVGFPYCQTDGRQGRLIGGTGTVRRGGSWTFDRAGVG